MILATKEDVRASQARVEQMLAHTSCRHLGAGHAAKRRYHQGDAAKQSARVADTAESVLSELEASPDHILLKGCLIDPRWRSRTVAITPRSRDALASEMERLFERPEVSAVLAAIEVDFCTGRGDPYWRRSIHFVVAVRADSVPMAKAVINAVLARPNSRSVRRPLWLKHVYDLAGAVSYILKGCLVTSTCERASFYANDKSGRRRRMCRKLSLKPAQFVHLLEALAAVPISDRQLWLN